MTAKRGRGFYGFTIKTFENKERRADPSGNQKRVLIRGFEIIRTDVTVKSLIIWDRSGKTYKSWTKDSTGKITRIK
jgi:hypothetical protein